jgi:hypothetical protein
VVNCASGGDFSTGPSGPPRCIKALRHRLRGSWPEPAAFGACGCRGWALAASHLAPSCRPPSNPQLLQPHLHLCLLACLLASHPTSAMQAVNRCTRCHCGRAVCMGHHTYTTSAHAAQAAAAQPAYAEEDCVSTDLAARHQVCVCTRRYMLALLRGQPVLPAPHPLPPADACRRTAPPTSVATPASSCCRPCWVTSPLPCLWMTT